MSRTRLYGLGLVGAILIAGGAWAFRRLLTGLPDIHRLEEYTPSLTTRVFDSAGELVSELSIEKRALLILSKIPVDLQNAVIAVEDDNFFKHWGVSPRGILRSAVANFLAGGVVQGGSTITQQLSKQIFLTRERTIVRKVKEILLSIQIERNFSKPEIFQHYLNQVYFGEAPTGCGRGALYFGKEVFTLADALAGLVRAPRAILRSTTRPGAAAAGRAGTWPRVHDQFKERKRPTLLIPLVKPVQMDGPLFRRACPVPLGAQVRLSNPVEGDSRYTPPSTCPCKNRRGWMEKGLAALTRRLQVGEETREDPDPGPVPWMFPLPPPRFRGFPDPGRGRRPV